MSVKTWYAAVPGDVGDPVDLCAADAREDVTEAEAMAREAAELLARPFRVVKVEEHALYRGKWRG